MCEGAAIKYEMDWAHFYLFARCIESFEYNINTIIIIRAWSDGCTAE
jgi:hypothetical protein